MLVARGGMVLPFLLTFGATMDSERFADGYVPLPVDREMDARLTRYVPVHVVTLAAVEAWENRGSGRRGDARTQAALERAGELWADGMARGELKPAMPERYGDDSIDGPKSELTASAMRLSSALASAGRAAGSRGEREEARRLLTLSLAPARAIRFFDLRTALMTPARFHAAAAGLRSAGYPEEAARALREAGPGFAGPGSRGPGGTGLGTLLEHMARLRREYRAHYGSASGLGGPLWRVDPIYESSLVRGTRMYRLLGASLLGPGAAR